MTTAVSRDRRAARASIERDGNRRLDDVDAGLTAEHAGMVLDYLRAVTCANRAR